MNRIYSVLLITLVLTVTALGQNRPTPTTGRADTDLAGEYIYSSGFVGAEYKLFGDGRFEYSSFSDCCDPVWREAGTYLLEGDQLRLKLTAKTLSGYNLLDARQATKAFRKLYDRKEEVKPGDIKTEYSMNVVKWGSRTYLVPPERLHLFVAAICFGIEPRTRVIDRKSLTSRFFLRHGDETKDVSGIPTLPESYVSILYQAQIKTTITHFNESDRGTFFTVDKGSRDGIKVGMPFAVDSVKPDKDIFLWVESVNETSAQLKSLAFPFSPGYGVGSVLVSRTTPPNVGVGKSLP